MQKSRERQTPSISALVPYQQILSHRSSRRLQIYVFPWNQKCHAERGNSTSLCKQKVPGGPSRCAMTDASSECSLLDLMHVRFDLSATPIVAPPVGMEKIGYRAGEATRARTRRRLAVESTGPFLQAAWGPTRAVRHLSN